MMSLFEVRVNKEIRRGNLVLSALYMAGLGSSLARVIVLCRLWQDSLLSQCLSPDRTINGY